MKKLIACLKNVTDLTGAFEGASLRGEPIKAWEDNVTFARSGTRQVLTFIRPLQDAMHTEAGKKGYETLNGAFLKLRAKLGGRDLDKDAMKLIDPNGHFLESHEHVHQFYRADAEKRVDAFMQGKLGPDGLLGGIEKKFVMIKSDIVDMLNSLEQFTKKEGVRSTRVWGLEDDVKEPLMKWVQKENDINVLPYDMSGMISKKVYVRLMSAENPDLVPFNEWFGTVYPQLAKAHVYNPVIKATQALIPEMSPAEQVRMDMTLNRIAGKKTPAQKIIDGIVDWAREDAGLPKLEFSPSSRYAMALSRNFYRGVLWANPGAALVNLTQSINTAAKFGPMRTLEGAVNFMSSEGRDLIRRSETSLFGEFHSFFRSTPGMLGKLDDTMVGFGLFNRAEYLNRGLAMHAGLSDYFAKNGIDGLKAFLALEKTDPNKFFRGIRHGLDAANETQFLYSVVHQSPLFHGPFSKLFLGQLMTYPINQSEFLWRSMKNDPVWFLPRYLALTGAAGMGAYYGAGISLKAIGGASMAASVAPELWREGYKEEALSAGLIGMVGHLPGTFSLERGLTPMNGALIDTFVRIPAALEQGDAGEISKAFASATRSWLTMMPGFLAIRRASEAMMTQLFNEGKRYEPGSEGAGKVGSALQATGLVPLFNAFLDKYFGMQVPGIGPGGRLSQVESPMESLKSGLGIRSREAELRSQKLDITHSMMESMGGDRAAVADNMAQALERQDAETFQALVQDAVQRGLIVDNRDLKILLTNAIKARTLTKEQKLEQKLPRALKLKMILEKNMEED